VPGWWPTGHPHTGWIGTICYAVEVGHVSPGTVPWHGACHPSRAAAVAQMYSTAAYQTSTSAGSCKHRLVRAAFLNFLPAGRVFMRFNSLVGRALIRIVGRRAIDTFFTALVGCYLESRETHVSEETADTGCCSSEHTSPRARNPCEV
jgi:hypothetical protein